MKDSVGALVLSALRGVMGDWTYYCALVDLWECVKRVDFADKIQPHQGLSDMIQRGLDETRRPEIAEYLLTQSERLFNSLVIATYGGSPNWFPLSNVAKGPDEDQLGDLPDETVQSVGFLTFTGKEKLFAIDGQHRLAGMKAAVEQAPDRDWYDEVPVVFVGHKDDRAGRVRSRRLFTTLNKNARAVTKRDTIALDEDDVMAICVRRLIEQGSERFGKGRIALVAENNMPQGDETSLTTIGNLYDVLAILFSRAAPKSLRRTRKVLRKTRPENTKLDDYFELAWTFFETMRNEFEELNAYFAADDTRTIVRRYRIEGASILFRPVGLEMFATIISTLAQEMSLADAVRLASKLPRALEVPPYVHLVWDPSSNTIRRFSKMTVRELLLHMLGGSAANPDDLLTKYRREVGNQELELPNSVV